MKKDIFIIILISFLPAFCAKYAPFLWILFFPINGLFTINWICSSWLLEILNTKNEFVAFLGYSLGVFIQIFTLYIVYNIYSFLKWRFYEKK